MNLFADAVTKLVRIILCCLVRCRVLKRSEKDEKSTRTDENAHVCEESFSKEKLNHPKGRKSKKRNLSCFDNFSETKSCSCFGGKSVQNLKKSVLERFEKERLHLEKEQTLFQYLLLCVSCFESDCAYFCEQMEKFCGACASPKRTRCLRRKLRILFQAHTKLKRKIETFEKNNFGSEVAQKAAGKLCQSLIEHYNNVQSFAYEMGLLQLRTKANSVNMTSRTHIVNTTTQVGESLLARIDNRVVELPLGAPDYEHTVELPRGAPKKNSVELPLGAPSEKVELPTGAPMVQVELPTGAPMGNSNSPSNNRIFLGNCARIHTQVCSLIEQDFVENSFVTKNCCNGNVTEFDLDFTGEKCPKKVECDEVSLSDANGISEATCHNDHIAPCDGVSDFEKNLIPSFAAAPKNSSNTYIESVVLNSASKTFNQKSAQDVCDITVHETPILCCGSGELPGVQGPVGPFPANKNQGGACGNDGNAAMERLIEGMERMMVLNAQQMQALNHQSEQAVELQRHQVQALESQAAALQRQTDIQREIADARRNEQNSPKRLEIRLKDLPAFDGIDGKLIVKFFADFDRCMTLGSWNNAEALVWLESCLAGIALAEFQASGAHRTVANAKQALLRRFLPESKREVIWEQVENVRQGETESVGEYYARFLELKEIALGNENGRFAEQMAFRCFLAGLYSSEIRIVTQRRKCRSLAEAVQFIEEEETRQESKRARDCVFVENFGENNGNQSPNPGRFRGKCYSCGQSGHIARECTGYY